MKTEPSSFSIALYSMMESLSSALDLINPALDSHHRITCYIACSLAEEMAMGDEDFNNLFAASLLHDIGGIALMDRLKLLDFEVRRPHDHAELGYILLSKFEPFVGFSDLVRHHHVDWQNGKGENHNGHPVSFLSHLIHLADRVAVIVDRSLPIFEQVAEIRDKVMEHSGEYFMPEHVEAFLSVSRKEFFWLDIISDRLNLILRKKSRLPTVSLDTDGLLMMSQFYALIIDTRSRFTATHSSGVATCARELALLFDVSDDEAKKFMIAGYLHDIGKLAVPDSILEKNGKLSLEEWRTVRSHTYYTRQILESIAGLDDITDWASDHHENLGGDGYPYRRTARKIPLGSRILAVADVFTALSEDRPYRAGMKIDEIIEVLDKMVVEKHLDDEVVGRLKQNIKEVYKALLVAQERENLKLSDFWEKAQSLLSDEQFKETSGCNN